MEQFFNDFIEQAFNLFVDIRIFDTYGCHIRICNVLNTLNIYSYQKKEGSDNIFYRTQQINYEIEPHFEPENVIKEYNMIHNRFMRVILLLNRLCISTGYNLTREQKKSIINRLVALDGVLYNMNYHNRNNLTKFAGKYIRSK